jgi:hypothetical protein
MPGSEDGPPYPYIWKKLKAGQVIPFIGAGASIGTRPDGTQWHSEGCSFLPKASELAEYLAATMDLPDEAPKELMAVAEYFNSRAGADALTEELEAIFAREYPVPPLHSELAGFDAPLLFVTSNYDDLIERALGERRYHLVVHRPVDQAQMVVWRPPDEETRLVHGDDLDVDPEEETIVYKIHGTAHRQGQYEPGYLITEGHYLQFLGRMTEDDLVPPAIGEAFSKRHFLFLGYGLRDWNVRIILRQLHSSFSGRASWWIDPYASRLDDEFWRRQGIFLFRVTNEQFVRDLQTRGPLQPAQGS